jgi:hypothetical protein
MEPITFFSQTYRRGAYHYIKKKKREKPLQTHTPTPQKTTLLAIQLACDKG